MCLAWHSTFYNDRVREMVPPKKAKFWRDISLDFAFQELRIGVLGNG